MSNPSRWVEREVDGSRWWAIEGASCTVHLVPRAAHCDRGRWLAQLEAFGGFARSVDDQDGWPRYYFDLERAKLEVEAWLKRRGQWVVPGRVRIGADWTCYVDPDTGILDVDPYGDDSDPHYSEADNQRDAAIDAAHNWFENSVEPDANGEAVCDVLVDGARLVVIGKTQWVYTLYPRASAPRVLFPDDVPEEEANALRAQMRDRMEKTGEDGWTVRGALRPKRPTRWSRGTR